MIDESRVAFTWYDDGVRRWGVTVIVWGSARHVVIGFKFPVVIKAAQLGEFVNEGLEIYVLFCQHMSLIGTQCLCRL